MKKFLMLLIAVTLTGCAGQLPVPCLEIKICPTQVVGFSTGGGDVLR